MRQPTLHSTSPEINQLARQFQIPVVSGGRLITSLSKANVGQADYSQKTNLRRDRDAEVRREGYLPFSPLPAIANQGTFDATLACYRLVELTRGDGTKALLGFSRSTVKLFSNTLGTWSTIGSGYSASGKRWQVVTINSTLVANNGVDLPIYWNIGDAAVTPMKELREVGVVRVGRICENNGFLIIADVTEFIDYELSPWMNGYTATWPVTGTSAKAANFIYNDPADRGVRFDVTTGAATVTADIGVVYGNSAAYLWLKKVDTGGHLVVTPPSTMGFTIDLTTAGDMALIYWDVIRAAVVAVVFPLGVVPAYDPYGTPPANLTQRIPWQVANSEYGRPEKWAPNFEIQMPSSSTTITLPFPSSIFVAGVTRVAVINGGPLGGTLGGQEHTPNGVLVTGVSGKTLTLEVPTDPDLSYYRFGSILRWTDVSSLVGKYDLQGDNSEITSLATLREWLVVTRTTGIYNGRYTGDPNAPFVFTPAYAGSNVPFWPDAIANVNGDYLLYPARGGRLYAYNGTTWPVVHDVTDLSASLFFNGYDQDDEIFVADNVITKEIFFCYPDKTLAFDYDTPGGTLSLINQAFDAAAMVHKPGTTDFWFIMAIGRFIKTYGLAYGLTPIQTWLRDGVAVESTMLYGMWSAGDQGHEKLLRELTPIFSSLSPNAAIKVELGVTHNPNATVTQKLVPAESLPTPSGRNYVTCCFQAIYFEPRITITDTNDRDCRLTGIIYEADLVGGFGGVTRSIN